MKNQLIDRIGIFLLKQGFTVKTLTRSSFDLLARKQTVILLVKALEDANSITKEYVDEMGIVSAYIGAIPVIIAEKAGSKLEDNILYTRFDMYTMNLNTLFNSINNKLPFIKRTQAGLTASIDGDKLRKKREQLGYSLNYLSKRVGVTKRMITRYENQHSEITVSKAMRIYSIFGEEVFNEINIFSSNRKIKSNEKSDFSKKYVNLGFKASDMQKTPFDIIAKKGNELILTEIGDKTKQDFSTLSRLLDADNLVIFRKKKPKDVPAVTKAEFLEFEKANELIRFLKEF